MRALLRRRGNQQKKSMVRIEFLRGFKCYQRGDTREVHDHFAHVLIEQGIAKAVKAPQRNKMIEEPVMEK